MYIFIIGSICTSYTTRKKVPVLLKQIGSNLAY
jgi:hypothetical protein